MSTPHANTGAAGIPGLQTGEDVNKMPRARPGTAEIRVPGMGTLSFALCRRMDSKARMETPKHDHLDQSGRSR